MSEVQKRTGTFKSFDDTPVYFEVRGQGRPIVMAYGIGCPMNHWRFQVEHFSKYYQTILFDYRGHHNTPVPEDRANLSLDAIVRDLHGLLGHLEIEKASLWGHSYGVQLLLRAYELYPEIFVNLVSINGFASNPIKGMFGVDVVEKMFPYIKGGYASFPDLLSRAWKASVANPLAIPVAALAGGFNLNLTKLKDIEVYTRNVSSMDLGIFMTLFEQMMEYDARHVLSQITVPTLIISGNKDGVTPPAHQVRMHHEIAGSELQKVPYGSHCTQLDLPDFVNLRIEKFLSAHEYGPTK
jgi:pimeloyl-ACP methyl ester carboxylesterase